jgi:hypothetical protein
MPNINNSQKAQLLGERHSTIWSLQATSGDFNVQH